MALHEPVAHRLLRRYGLQNEDARDVMQELFMAVSWSIERWDPARSRGSLRRWLRRVARNLVINWLKKRERSVLASGGSGAQGCSTWFRPIPARKRPSRLFPYLRVNLRPGQFCEVESATEVIFSNGGECTVELSHLTWIQNSCGAISDILVSDSDAAASQEV